MVIDTTLLLPHLQSSHVQPKRIAKGMLLKPPPPGLRSLPLSKPILLHLMSLPLLKPPRSNPNALPLFKLPCPGLMSLPLLQLPRPDLLFKSPRPSLRPLPLSQLRRPGLGPLSLLTPLFPNLKSLPQSFRGSTWFSRSNRRKARRSRRRACQWTSMTSFKYVSMPVLFLVDF